MTAVLEGRSDALRLGVRSRLTVLAASVVGLLVFGWPLVAGPGSALEPGPQTPLLLALVLVTTVVVLLVAVADGVLDVKAVAVLGLLSAVGAVLRPLSAGTAGVELVFLVIVLGGRVLGPGFGLVLGSTTILTSALLTGGVGPWMPYQMIAASWVGLGAGLLPRGLHGRGEVLALAAYGAVAGLLFGTAMNLAFWPFGVGEATALSYVPGAPLLDNLRRFALYDLATSLGWDVGRAVTTAVGVLVLGRPVLAVLRRAAVRAAFAPAGARTGTVSASS